MAWLTRREFFGSFGALFAPRRKKKKSRRGKARRQSAPVTLPAGRITAQDKRMLLRSFNDEDLRRQRIYNLLSMYSAEEIIAEMDRRGIE